MPELTAEQRKNIRTALKVARAKGASPKEQKALVEAMGVESGYRDLNYGDRDSLGILQQRNNGAWGKAKEGVATDVGQFLDVARQKNASGKYGSAGSLAQAVQVSGFPDRYDQRSGEASRILAQYGNRGPAARVKGVKAPPQPAAGPAAVPGVDNSAQRRALVGSFLQQGGVQNTNAVLGLAAQYGQAKDTPATYATATAPGAAPAKVSKQSALKSAGALNALQWAESKVGAAGSAESGGENHGQLADYANRRFGMSGQPWCAMFTSMAVTKGGAPSSARTASVAEVRRKALAGDGYKKGLISPASAKPGDLVLFGDAHIGMIKSVDGDQLTYVGGNQSDSVTQATTSGKGVSVVRPKYGSRK